MPPAEPDFGSQTSTPTFAYVMTDVVDSTVLWLEDDQKMDQCLERLDRLWDRIATRHSGSLIGERGEGDSHFVVFGDPSQAVQAAVEVGLALLSSSSLNHIKLRTAIHAGPSSYRSGNYYGTTINICARMRSLAKPGQILASRAVKEATSGSDDCAFTSLGSYSLRNFPDRQELFQVIADGLPSRFPPIHEGRHAKRTLPVFLTSFQGREKDQERLTKSVLQNRLTTLKGPGGVGKTRLAVRVGESLLSQFEGGVRFVDLSLVDDSTHVLSALCSEASDGLVSNEDGLVEYLGEERPLLIVDNCEHVFAEVHRILSRLLTSCPRLHVLATSRKALGIPGEKICPLNGLQVDELCGPGEAVNLFLERSSSEGTSEFDTGTLAEISDLCAKLDGLPLAIEIVSKWTDLLSIQEISNRIDEFLVKEVAGAVEGSTSRTLAASIESSCRLLSPPTREILKRLSAFPASWSIESASAICAEPGGDTAMIEVSMRELLSMSLIYSDAVALGKRRFRMLQTTRQVVAKQAGEALQKVQAPFVSYFASTCRTFQSMISEGREERALAIVGVDYEAILRALEWSLGSNPSQCLSMAEDLRTYWLRNSRFMDGKEWYERLVASSNLDQRALGVAAAGLSSFEIRLDHLDRATQLLSSAESSLRDEGGYDWARVVGNLGTIFHRQGDMLAARNCFSQCLEVFHQHHRYNEEGLALINLGVCMMRLREPLEDCIAVFERSRQLGMLLESPSMIGNANSSLAEAHAQSGDPKQALRLCRDALACYSHGTWLIQTAWTLVNVANMLNSIERIEASATIWHAAHRMEKLSGSRFSVRQRDILNDLRTVYDTILSAATWQSLEAECHLVNEVGLIDLAIKTIETSVADWPLTPNP